MIAKSVQLDAVDSFLRASPERIYWPSDLKNILEHNKALWNLPRTMTSAAFGDWLVREKKLTCARLVSDRYPDIVRFGSGRKLSPVLVALSTKRGSYLSHGSALWVHGLGGGAREIYVNCEQAEKPRNSGALAQSVVDRVFGNKQRQTKLIYRFGGATITMLNGKHTNQLGVSAARTPAGESVEVTCIERTLIDITVRPVYAGGVKRVVRAFRAARGKASISKLVQLLRALDYTYPYQQAVGFYLNRAGFGAEDQEQLRKMGVQLDFYLCHGIGSPRFDEEWRVWYPSDLT